jgi:hypothetical protein
MTINRLAAGLLIASAALAACDPAATPTTEKAEKTATETLLAAVPDTSTPAFHYAVKGGLNPFSGVIDPAGEAMTVEIAQKVPDTPITLSMRFLVAGETVWTKIAFKGATADMGLPKLPKKWMALDPAKSAGSDLADLKYSEAEIDPGYVTELVQSATGLAETAPGHFTGTTDLTKAADAEIVEALTDEAKTAPLEVVLDAQGRIATATVKLPDGGTYAVTYGQYGTAKSLAAPADAVKAPADVYDLLRG